MVLGKADFCLEERTLIHIAFCTYNRRIYSSNVSNPSQNLAMHIVCFVFKIDKTFEKF